MKLCFRVVRLLRSGICRKTDKFDSVKITNLAIFSFTVFKGQFLRKILFKNLSRLFHCSVIKVLCLSFVVSLAEQL